MTKAISFVCRWIWQRLPEATQKRCYFFNSFFYKKLSEKQAGVGPLTASGRCEAARAAYERVRKWTKVNQSVYIVLHSLRYRGSPGLLFCWSDGVWHLHLSGWLPHQERL